MNKNSMLCWYGRIKQLNIPQPDTLFTGLDILSVQKAAHVIGYPCFLRTDLCSGKHDWQDSCFVQYPAQLDSHILKVLEANQRWQMLGIEPQAFAVRQFLHLESSFTAFAGHMPINRERRYFVRDGEVECSHAYWPVNAFNNHPARMADDPEWEQKLQWLNTRDETEECLFNYARRVGQELGGYWSVDFARDINKKWWLLDMALGENSYHMSHGGL